MKLDNALEYDFEFWYSGRMSNPDVWPQFRADVSLRHTFGKLDVDLPQVAQHLTDREVEEDVIGAHTLSLSVNNKPTGYREPYGHYWYERAWIDVYPEAALKFALGQRISEASKKGDWNRPLRLEASTKQLLDECLTHELQHLVDLTNEPGAFEANMDYRRSTNRMLNRHVAGVGVAGLGFVGALNMGMNTLSHLNPQASPILAGLGVLAAGAVGFGAMARNVNTFGMALRDVRYNNNPFERSANAAEETETGNFFTVRLTHDVDVWAQHSIEEYRRYILRA